MAQSNIGTAITPKRAGNANSRSIALGTIGQQQAHMQGLTTANESGVTFEQYLERWAASGGPLWAGKQTGSGQCDYFVTDATTGARRTGIVHKFRHLESEGKRTACMGGHAGKGSSCATGATAPNKGDNVTRWRADGSNYGPVANESNASKLRAAAHAAIDARVGQLYGMGFTKADIEATPSIAQYVALLAYVVPSKAGSKAAAPAASKPASKARSKASKPRTVALRPTHEAVLAIEAAHAHSLDVRDGTGDGDRRARHLNELLDGNDFGGDDADREPTAAELAALEN